MLLDFLDQKLVFNPLKLFFNFRKCTDHVLLCDISKTQTFPILSFITSGWFRIPIKRPWLQKCQLPIPLHFFWEIVMYNLLFFLLWSWFDHKLLTCFALILLQMTRANHAHFFNWEKDDVAGVEAVPKLWVRGFDQLGANVVDETNLG